MTLMFSIFLFCLLFKIKFVFWFGFASAMRPALNYAIATHGAAMPLLFQTARRLSLAALNAAAPCLFFAVLFVSLPFPCGSPRFDGFLSPSFSTPRSAYPSHPAPRLAGAVHLPVLCFSVICHAAA
ncbi:MAG: hypothetical protein ACSW8H_01725 [bacterium]